MALDLASGAYACVLPGLFADPIVGLDAREGSILAAAATGVVKYWRTPESVQVCSKLYTSRVSPSHPCALCFTSHRQEYADH